MKKVCAAHGKHGKGMRYEYADIMNSGYETAATVVTGWGYRIWGVNTGYETAATVVTGWGYGIWDMNTGYETAATVVKGGGGYGM